MIASLRLVHSLDRDWPPRRRRQLARRVRLMLDCSAAVWERDGIQACLEVAADHWKRIDADYPDGWVDIATSEGVW